MPRVVHFEIHAGDPQRAINFYTTIFDWKFSQWGEEKYWMITTGENDQPGINGGLLPRQGEIDGQAVIAYVCTIDVDSFDNYNDAIIKAGGVVAVPKMPIPGLGWLGYYKDTEGNIFGIIQNDPSAK